MTMRPGRMRVAVRNYPKGSGMDPVTEPLYCDCVYNKCPCGWDRGVGGAAAGSATACNTNTLYELRFKWLAAPLLLQLPSDAPGTAAEVGPSAWVSIPHPTATRMGNSDGVSGS